MTYRIKIDKIKKVTSDLSKFASDTDEGHSETVRGRTESRRTIKMIKRREYACHRMLEKSY